MGSQHRISFRWQRRPGGRPTAALRGLAAATLQMLAVESCEVGVLVCDDPTIRSLNRRYRASDRPTDVLSFPDGSFQPDGTRYLGDVAISIDTAARNAREAGITVERELEFLVLHALLHLCGFDHETDEGEMEAREAELRREFRL